MLLNYITSAFSGKMNTNNDSDIVKNFVKKLYEMYTAYWVDKKYGDDVQKEAMVIFKFYGTNDVKQKLDEVVKTAITQKPLTLNPDEYLATCRKFTRMFFDRYGVAGVKFNTEAACDMQTYCCQQKVEERMEVVFQQVEELRQAHKKTQMQSEAAAVHYPHVQTGKEQQTVMQKSWKQPQPGNTLNDIQIQQDVHRVRNENVFLKERMTELENFCESLRKEKTDLLDRLSAEMDAKVSGNEQDLENISRSNRPSKISEEYSLLCSTQWLNAKDSLDKLQDVQCHPEKIKQFFLSSFFQVAYKFSEQALEDISTKMSDVMYAAFVDKTSEAAISNSKGVASSQGTPRTVLQSQKVSQQECPPEITKGLLNFLRRDADPPVPAVNMKDFLEMVKTYLTGKGKASDDDVCIDQNALQAFLSRCYVFERNRPLEDFVKACMKMSWKMAMQSPPMKYDTSGVGEKWKGDQLQEVAWGSDDPKDPNIVLFYTLPALNHGPQTLVKGKVICGKDIA